MINNPSHVGIKAEVCWEFPGRLVVWIRRFHCHGPGSIPGQGTEISQAIRRGQKNKQNKTNKQKKVVCL